jgi:hypothetical protein
MRVRASSLNYRDLMVLKGGGRGPTQLGVVPLSDGAGEVAAIGDGVTRVKPGDCVIGNFHPRWFGGPLSTDYLTDRLGANLDGMAGDEKSLKTLAVGGHVSLIGASLSRSGTMLDPLLIADRPRRHGRCDKRPQPRRFRGDEPGHRIARLAAGNRPVVPVRRGERSLPAFRGTRPSRQGRDLARLRN